MNQRAVAPNAPAHSVPAMNGRSENARGTSEMTPRQREVSQNRPPSAMRDFPRSSNTPINNNAPRDAGNRPRLWEAQGNTTDRGRAPAGFGSSNRPANTPAQTSPMSRGDRPPWARTSQSGVSQMQPRGSFSEPSRGATNSPGMRESSRPAAPSYNSNQPDYSNGGRSYEPPQRTYRDTPSYNNNRGYWQPRSYNPPPSRSYSAPRTYSAPSRSYPAPSRSYSAPSRSYSGGGGGGNRGGGGGSRSAGGSTSHARH